MSTSLLPLVQLLNANMFRHGDTKNVLDYFLYFSLQKTSRQDRNCSFIFLKIASERFDFGKVSCYATIQFMRRFQKILLVLIKFKNLLYSRKRFGFVLHFQLRSFELSTFE